MISRRLRKVVAVIAGALAAGVPVALIHHGVDAYIERQSAEEVRLAAQRAVAPARIEGDSWQTEAQPRQP